MATKLEEALDAFGVSAIAYGCDKATLDQTRALRAAVLAAHEADRAELAEQLRLADEHSDRWLREVLAAFGHPDRDVDWEVTPENTRAKIEELLALLREVEWSAGTLGMPACPRCGALRQAGRHAPECRLAAFLR